MYVYNPVYHPEIMDDTNDDFYRCGMMYFCVS